MNDHHQDMIDLANDVDDIAERQDLDQPIRGQFRKANSDAMRAIFDSHDHHESGNTQAAHAGLLVAGKHIVNAAKLVEGAAGYRIGELAGVKNSAEILANQYKYAFRS